MLTRDAIANVFQKKLTNTRKICLQVLDQNSDLGHINQTQRITLSDGNWFASFKLLGSLSNTARESLRQFDVVLIDLVFNPRTNSGTVTSFTIEESGSASKIGAPQNVENFENMRRINEARTGGYGRRQVQNYDDDDCTEIANLTPYDSDWKIKGRVIKKTDKRTFTKRDGNSGCVFNIHILDENNDRIQGIFFTEAANEFYEKVYMGKVYYFRGGDIKKVRNPKYNTTGNDLEIMFNRNSRITEVQNTDVIPQFFYKFIPLKQIEEIEENKSIDVLAIVHKVGDADEIRLRSGEMRKKQQINLVDDTGFVCSLTLWGEQIAKVNVKENDIIGFSELKVRDFRGKQLSFSYNSKVIEDNLRDLPLYRKLMAERNRGVTVSKNISETSLGKIVVKKIRQVDQECKAILNDNYESKETKLYYNVHAYVSFVKERISYPSCHNDNCKKKVIENFTKQYECARCEQTYDQPKCK